MTDNNLQKKVAELEAQIRKLKKNNLGLVFENKEEDVVEQSKTKGGVLIVDTKAGITAESNDTKYKAEALQKWIKGKKGFDGGIVVKDGPNGWKINRNVKYSFDSSMKGWEVFDLKS